MTLGSFQNLAQSLSIRGRLEECIREFPDLEEAISENFRMSQEALALFRKVEAAMPSDHPEFATRAIGYGEFLAQCNFQADAEKQLHKAKAAAMRYFDPDYPSSLTWFAAAWHRQ